MSAFKSGYACSKLLWAGCSMSEHNRILTLANSMSETEDLSFSAKSCFWRISLIGQIVLIFAGLLKLNLSVMG